MRLTVGRSVSRFFGALCLVGISACASTTAQNAAPTSPRAKAAAIDPMATGWGSAKVGARMGDLLAMLGDNVPKTREQVAVIARRANAEPFGSPQNPVRADGPQGQRAYIARLLCAGGDTPRIVNRQNIGAGVYGTIVDQYDLACTGQANQSIAIDMYHDWVENRPAQGFTIVEQRPLPYAPIRPSQ